MSISNFKKIRSYFITKMRLKFIYKREINTGGMLRLELLTFHAKTPELPLPEEKVYNP